MGEIIVKIWKKSYSQLSYYLVIKISYFDYLYLGIKEYMINKFVLNIKVFKVLTTPIFLLNRPQKI